MLCIICFQIHWNINTVKYYATISLPPSVQITVDSVIGWQQNGDGTEGLRRQEEGEEAIICGSVGGEHGVLPSHFWDLQWVEWWLSHHLQEDCLHVHPWPGERWGGAGQVPGPEGGDGSSEGQHQSWLADCLMWSPSRLTVTFKYLNYKICFVNIVW